MRGLSLVVASEGHSSSQCAGLSLSRPLLLRSTGSRHAGSVVVAHGPSCSAACGVFPNQGSNPCPLHWQADSQPLRHQGSPEAWSLNPWTARAVPEHNWFCPHDKFDCKVNFGKPNLAFYYFFKINLFIYFWLHWVFVAVHRLFSSCGEWGLLFLAVRGLQLRWFLLLRSTGSRRAGSVVVARGL